MTKNDFVDALASKLKVNKKEAERCCSAVADTLEESIQTQGKFRFLNFGTFSVVERAARQCIVPKTRETIHVPAKKVLKFKPSKSLANLIAGK